MYHRLYEGIDLPVVLDDVDDAFTDPQKKNLLKELLENDELKTASWGSGVTHRDQQGQPLPKTFSTRSRFAIIGNTISKRNEANLGAILSRAFCIEFVPTVYEVHKYVSEWFPDEEIFSYVGDNLHKIIEPDVRDYGQALKLKIHGEDWKSLLLSRWLEDERLVVVAQILADKSLTYDQQVARFKAQTGQSRRTYAYRLAQLRELRGTDALIEPVSPDDLKLQKPSSNAGPAREAA
jgi:hypothetical protein